MSDDPSRGWDAVADRFTAIRSDAGADVVRRWARGLPAGAAVLDIGCGDGAPIAQALVDEGCVVSGVDASPRLLAAFRARFPAAEAVCEAAEASDFFGRRFDGAVAIGLVFLLPEADQRQVIARVGTALKPGGRFLFTAPREACEWADSLTGRRSLSLGAPAYAALLKAGGMRLAGEHRDAGGNHHYDAVRAGEPAGGGSVIRS